MATWTPLARVPCGGDAPLAVSGSITLLTVTSNTEPPARARSGVPTAAPRGRGGRRRRARDPDDDAEVAEGVDRVGGLVCPRGADPPHAVTPTAASTAGAAIEAKRGRDTVAQHTAPS
jgi:hypothetical protein